MDGKISVSVIYVEATIYLLLYNLHDCTFKIILKNQFYYRNYPNLVRTEK